MDWGRGGNPFSETNISYSALKLLTTTISIYTESLSVALKQSCWVLNNKAFLEAVFLGFFSLGKHCKLFCIALTLDYYLAFY